MLTTDPNEDVRWTAMGALSSLEPPPSAFDSLIEFWQSQLQNRNDKRFRSRSYQASRIAYEQFQRLAELRERQATTDETTPGHFISGLHDHTG
jgi:hypothetical protein